MPLLRLSAEAMPFPDASFDMILCLEAIYYFPNVERFLGECQRILRPNGLVLICTANKEWQGFAPGALNSRYFSAQELSGLLAEYGFRTEILGAFPDRPDTLFSKLISLIRALAVNLHMIPKTMRAKEPLKRLFYGPLPTVPAEITDEGTARVSLAPVPPESNASHYKVIYAIGRR